ncbi:MAG: oligosaccharide flippase family protein, partial [Thermoleophilia bacterium]|nr:oligosaccharide flippase family protein [Thermoleophilia bacterium]
RTVTSLYVLLAPLAVLWFTDDLAVVVGSVVVGRIASWGAHVVLCLKDLPSLRRGITFRASLVRPLLGFGGWMTAVNIINPVMVQMDRFLIGGLVSAAAVAYYATPQELMTRAWFLSNAVLGVMFPAFATSFVQDRSRTAAIFGRCLAHVGLILYPISLVAVALSREILTAWLGADFADEGTRVLQWFALGVFLNGMAQVPSALIQGIGRPDLTFKLHLVELPPYLLAAWFLIQGRGIQGAAIAWTARTALDLVLYVGAARAVLPESSRALRGLLVGVGAAVAGLGLVGLPLGMAARAWLLLAVGLSFLAIAWRRLLSDAERSALLGAVCGVLLPRAVDAANAGVPREQPVMQGGP